MEIEFQSLTVNEAASDELELSSSSSNSSSTSSSSQSSPDDSSVSPSLGPDLPPLLQQAEQSISVTITVTAANVAGARIPPPRRTKEEVLKSLNESIAHRTRLRQLQKSERTYQKDASWHRNAGRRLSKELYLVVSLYAVLQGALFTAVAQSSVFSCADWWGPAGIVSAVTLGTVLSALDKLRRMGCEKQEAKKFERRQSAVYDKIELLYFRGSHCDIDALEPAHSQQFDDEPGMQCIFSVHGLLVLGFLVGFSALIMAACTQMLCRPCHCKA